MKTTNQTTKRFPNGFRITLYVAAVATLGFLNCYILKAGDPEPETNYSISLEAALTVNAEPEIDLEDWMLDFTPDYLVELDDEEVVLEDWMLDFTPDYLVELDDEEIVLEDWMLNFTPDYLIVDKEEEPVLEDWMLDPTYFDIALRYIAKSDQ